MVKGCVAFLFLFCLLSILDVFAEEGESIVLGIDDVILRAQKRDLELKSLRFRLTELTRSKKNLYRSFFPTMQTTISGSNVVNVDDPDTKAYNVNVTLEQVLFDQFSTPILLQSFGLSLREAMLSLERREKDLVQKNVQLYLDILLTEEKLKNKHEELKLHKTYLVLVREENIVGYKTMLDVINAESELLQTELELEELAAQRRILLKDLRNSIGLDPQRGDILLVNDFDHILSSLLFESDAPISFDQVIDMMSQYDFSLLDEGRLFHEAVFNDFEIAQLKLALAQNNLKKKLLAIQFLDNISLSYSVDFAGEQFFPANTTHTFAVNILLDFGLVSSDISVGRSRAESYRSRSSESASEILSDLNVRNRGRQLRFESYAAHERIENKQIELEKQIDVWLIKFASLLRQYELMKKREEVFEKNEEIFCLSVELGEAKRVDYLEFLIQKTNFLISKEIVKYDFVNLLWELESILNIKIVELI
jgi:hypothetical protein